jgi:hypothetical protein
MSANSSLADSPGSDSHGRPRCRSTGRRGSRRGSSGGKHSTEACTRSTPRAPPPIVAIESHCTADRSTAYDRLGKQFQSLLYTLLATVDRRPGVRPPTASTPQPVRRPPGRTTPAPDSIPARRHRPTFDPPASYRRTTRTIGAPAPWNASTRRRIRDTASAVPSPSAGAPGRVKSFCVSIVNNATPSRWGRTYFPT